MLAKLLQYADKGFGGNNVVIPGTGSGERGSNNGLTINFLLEDSSNKQKPSLAFEWRQKDANTLTSLCVDVLALPHKGCKAGACPGLTTPVCVNRGTCGMANQGLHIQGQLGDINYLKALSAMILPAPKTLDSGGNDWLKS